MARVEESSFGRPVVVLDAVRTPVGRYRGMLATERPDDLAASVVKAVTERTEGIVDAGVDDVVFGAANQAGEDNRNVARMASLLAGLPVTVPGSTVNRLCGSSLDALLEGYRAVALGDAECVIVGGVESMSRSPFVLAKPESGFPRALDLVDTTLGWRLVNPLMPREWTVSLGETAEIVAERCSVGRRSQDAFALASHERAVASIDSGAFAAETVAITTRDGTTVATDEGPRRGTSLEALGALPAAFRDGGSVTAGNSSTLNDGAAALVLASEARAAELGAAPIARVLGGAVAGVSPEVMGLGPIPALRRTFDRFAIGAGDLDAIELNEAFASQVLAVLAEFDLDGEDDRVNSRGGAIAIGHPLGASGARIATTLVHRLAARGGGLGVATMCVGVGQGIAVLLKA